MRCYKCAYASTLAQFISLLGLCLEPLYEPLVLPNAASIIFGTSDDSIALVVECARENFVFVTFSWVGSEALNLIAGLSAPQSAGLVARCSNNLVALRIKLDLTDFVLVALQDCRACSCKDIVNSGHTICTCCRQLITCLVKASVKHFVSVTTELFDALSSADIPKAGRSVDASGEAVVASEVKLAAG